MPPKKEYTKDELLKVALRIVKKSGLSKLSARKIASELGCSTTPVYSSYSSMEELEKDLVSYIIDILISYTEKEYTKNIFLNIGLGIVFFARANRKLYRILFLKGAGYNKMLKRFYQATDEQMKKDQISEYVSEEDRKKILEKMWIFTHGLSTLVSNRQLKDESDPFITDLLGQTGGDIIGSTLFHNNPALFQKMFKAKVK